ncbi:MAG: AbrB/MazE/SpoVT family DNA-binding domain-containing protein [Chloroflexi bacterium]|nr:AbrB/MazE/SpoVT family DNA-binding domain-containing protein [Chloroflexota bacterium]
MAVIKTKLGKGGRVVIPAEYRKRLGIEPGDEIIVSFKDGEIKITTVREAVRRAQEIVRRFVPEGVSLVDELIQERRREAARESRE